MIHCHRKTEHNKRREQVPVVPRVVKRAVCGSLGRSLAALDKQQKKRSCSFGRCEQSFFHDSRKRKYILQRKKGCKSPSFLQKTVRLARTTTRNGSGTASLWRQRAYSSTSDWKPLSHFCISHILHYQNLARLMRSEALHNLESCQSFAPPLLRITSVRDIGPGNRPENSPYG